MISTEGPVLWLAPRHRTMTPGVDGNSPGLRALVTAHRRGTARDLGKPGRDSIRLVARLELEGCRPGGSRPVGFDTEDHTLDRVARTVPGAGKDEHELAAAVKVGAFTPEEAAFRDEGEGCCPRGVGPLIALFLRWDRRRRRGRRRWFAPAIERARRRRSRERAAQGELDAT